MKILGKSKGLVGVTGTLCEKTITFTEAKDRIMPGGHPGTQQHHGETTYELVFQTLKEYEVLDDGRKMLLTFENGIELTAYIKSYEMRLGL